MKDNYIECIACGYVDIVDQFEFVDEPKHRCPKCGGTELEDFDMEDDE